MAKYSILPTFFINLITFSNFRKFCQQKFESDKPGASLSFDPGDVTRIYKIEFAELESGKITGNDTNKKFIRGEGENFLAQHFTHMVGKHQKQMQSPILFQRSIREDGNGTGIYTIDDDKPLVAGSYLTNYYLIKPQKNFHRAITIKIPLKEGAELLPNHTFHVFIASQGMSF